MKHRILTWLLIVIATSLVLPCFASGGNYLIRGGQSATSTLNIFAFNDQNADGNASETGNVGLAGWDFSVTVHETSDPTSPVIMTATVTTDANGLATVGPFAADDFFTFGNYCEVQEINLANHPGWTNSFPGNIFGQNTLDVIVPAGVNDPYPSTQNTAAFGNYHSSNATVISHTYNDLAHGTIS